MNTYVVIWLGSLAVIFVIGFVYGPSQTLGFVFAAIGIGGFVLMCYLDELHQKLIKLERELERERGRDR
jgi:hypothetical protein